MSVTSEWLSRKLGYGFAYDEQLPNPTDWIEAARAQVAVVPKFDPWRLIAKNPDATKLSGRGLPEELTTFRNYCHREKGFNIPIDDLRYPTNLSVTISHFRKMNSERDRLRQLQAQGKISEQAVSCNWWKKYNAFSWWRDTLTRGVDNVLGDTPVLNRFWHFWINHFSLNVDTCEGELFGNYYLTIRSNLTKRFEDLLFDAIWHPAMQEFLQNKDSVGPNSQFAQNERENAGGGPKSINENLARELLELYTVTTKANYTQDDVNGAVYILTGWGAHWDRGRHSARYFNPERHEPGEHRVMGKVYDDPNLESRLETLCRDLARHPLTAKHIALKLARHFIADEAPEGAVKEIENTFIKTKGSLVALHQTVIDEVIKAGSAYRKFMPPELWFWQTNRAVKEGLWLSFMDRDPNQGSDQINSLLFELGQLHSKSPQPNGWSDREIDWITPEYFDRRIRYAHSLGVNLYNPYSEEIMSKKFDPRSYVERISELNSDIVKTVKRAESYPVSFAVLFCSESFMRI